MYAIMIKIKVYPVKNENGQIEKTIKDVLVFGICVFTKTIDSPWKGDADEYYYSRI